MEVTGAVGNAFRHVLGLLAQTISTRTNIPYGIMMNRIRGDIIGTMMKINSQMVQATWSA